MQQFSEVPFPEFDGTQNCKGQDVDDFYRDDDLTKSANRWREDLAKRHCRNCAFITPCLEWGLHNEEFGVWGGTTENERRSMRKRAGVEIRPLRVRQDAWLTRITQAGYNGK